MLKILCIICIAVFFIKRTIKEPVNPNYQTTCTADTDSANSNSTDPNINSQEIYTRLTDFEKSEFYFNHRLDMVLKRKFPSLITWHTARRGISLLNQAIEVSVLLPENVEERIWISASELIGSFYIQKNEIPAAAVSDSNIPDELRSFLEKNAGIIDQKIRFAIEKHLNYAYFEFRNGESKDFMVQISQQVESAMDGIMCHINGSMLEMNVQNMLDE